MSHSTRPKSNRKPPRQRPAGLVGAFAAFLIFVAVGCTDSDPDRAAPGESTTTTLRRSTATEAPVATGDCGNIPTLPIGGAIDPAAIEPVPCTEPHDIEISNVFDYPSGLGRPFPGSTTVDGYAYERCVASFDDYVGTPYQDSVLDVVIIAPDEDGWNQDDRRSACVLYHVDFQALTQPAYQSGL